MNSKLTVKEVKEEKAIKSAAQTGEKTITVTTSFDATNSTVKLTRGTSDVLDKTAFSEDGKKITITTTNKIVAADYTVTVDEFTATVKGEVAKVAKIEILSDKAAAVKDTNQKYTKATVGYRVSDQFGSDITKTTSLTVSSSAKSATLSAKDHLITFTSADTDGFMIGRDMITVMLLDSGNTGVSENKVLTVDMEAYAKELTYEGVYNTEGKTLTEDSDLTTDTFYALFTAVDQYGNKFKSYKGVKENDDLYFTVMGGLTALDKAASGQTFTVLSKDGTDYLAYPLKFNDSSMIPAAGEASIQLLSKGGTSCTGTITVAEGNRVVTISTSNPEFLVGGEKTDIPFTATDAAGKEVTAYKTLKNVKISDGVGNTTLSWIKNTDGTGKLVLDATNCKLNQTRNQTAMVSYSFETTGRKFYQSTFTITEHARPVAIDGISADTELSASAKYCEIKVKDLKVEDQYGRTMSADALKTALNAQGAYRLDVNKPVVANEGSDILSVEYNPNKLERFTTADDVIAKIWIHNKGTETVTFKIHNGVKDGFSDCVNDSADVLFTVKDTANVETAKATVSEIYVVADGNACAENYKQEVVVKAGGVKLSGEDFTVSVPANLKVVSKDDAALGNTWHIYSSDTQGKYKAFVDGTADTVTNTIKITLNGTGETFTQDVTLSKVAPYVNAVTLKTDTYKVTTNGEALNKDEVYSVCVKELKDQYGKALSITRGGIAYANGTECNPKVTFKNIVADDKVTKVTNNGSESAELTVGPKFQGATMVVAYGSNVNEKKTAEINLVGVTDAADSSSVAAQWNALVKDNTKTDSDIASFIGSNNLLQSDDWDKLEKDVDKEKVAKVAKQYKNVSDESALATSIGAIAVTSAAVRTAINSASAFVVSGGTLMADGSYVVTASSIQAQASSEITSATITSISAITSGCAIVDGSSATSCITISPSAIKASDAPVTFTVTYVMNNSGISGSTPAFDEIITYEVRYDSTDAKKCEIVPIKYEIKK